MDNYNEHEEKIKFRYLRSIIRNGQETGFIHYLNTNATKDEIRLRWNEYVKELHLTRDYYPWYCDVFSELYEKKHIVRIYFDYFLAKNIHKLKADYEKDLIAMVRYGFKGASKGGINGILLLKYDDRNNIGKKYNNLVKTNFFKYRNNTIISTWIKENKGFEGCKIVSHGRHGKRIVGLISLREYEDRTCGDVLLLDVWKYSH